MNDLEQTNMLQPLVDEIETAVSNAKKEIAEKVNSVITETYWKIGKYIVEFEQDGNVKAAYGSKLLTTLSHQLTLRLGRGYSRPNLNNMRKFYLCYENCQTVSDKLTWSHICELIKIDDELERSFYEKECYKEKWDVRTLRRQMDSALFLRLATSRDKEGILALAREGITYDKPEDVIKDTYTLEFLGLPEKERYSEEDLEQKIIDNPDVTIREALHDILEDLKSQPDYNGAKGNIQREDELIPMDYDGLMEKAEEANRIIPESTPSSVVADFKAKTGELFHDISEMNPEEIEETVKCHVQAKIEEYDINATIVDVAVTGSRCRGLEHEGSDLDVVVELSTAEREDDLFNAFNEDGLHIGEVKVDINPITAQRTGTLESYLPQMEEYLEGVRQVREQEKESAEVTLTVSECGEFHNLGECYENIPTVDEAIAIWKQIPSERMNGIPAIGINILGRGAEPFEDYEIDVLSGKRIDLGVLDYVPDIKNNPQAMEVITELVAKLPDMEIDGVMSEEMEARVWELRMPDLPQEEQLAVELDRLSYDYDTVLYHDSTRNMTENVSELAESIKQGDTGHLTTWLADIISEGAVPEEIKRATELLEKLTEYKPLAKIEEAEEQNYNMIDNVLNNGVGEKAQREENKRMEEKPTVRLSLKSRLAEKKSQVEGQSKEHDVQENEKKSQREM